MLISTDGPHQNISFITMRMKSIPLRYRLNSSDIDQNCRTIKLDLWKLVQILFQNDSIVHRVSFFINTNLHFFFSFGIRLESFSYRAWLYNNVIINFNIKFYLGISILCSVHFPSIFFIAQMCWYRHLYAHWDFG